MSQLAEGFNRDSLGLYLDEIARTPLLSAEQEVELAKAMEAGLVAEYILDPEAHRSEELDENKILALKKLGELAITKELERLAEEGRRAKQHFINANLGLAVSIARKYAWSTLPLLDRIQEGNQGLIRAVEKFDYTKGNKFSTYAEDWIHRYIRNGIADQERMIRLPRDVHNEVQAVNKAERLLVVRHGKDPEPEAIAEEIGTSPDRVIELKRWRQVHLSLDTPINAEESEATLADLIPQEAIPSVEEAVLDIDKRARLLRLLDSLDDKRKKEVLLLRYGIHSGKELLMREVAEVVDLSQAGAIREKDLALQRLRDMVPDRESFDNAPAGMNFATDRPKKPGRQNQRLMTISESKVLQNLIQDGLDLAAKGLTETEMAMLTQYSQKRSISAIQREFGTKAAHTKTILKKCIEAVRSDIDAALGEP